MKEINFLQAKQAASKKRFPLVPLLQNTLKVYFSIILFIIVLYVLGLGATYLLQKNISVAAQAPIKQLSPVTATSSSEMIPYGTDSNIASLAAAIPLQKDLTVNQQISIIPSDLYAQLTDQIHKITIYRLVNVLSAYWIDQQRFPTSQKDDAKTWIQELQGIGDISSLYAKYLLSISADAASCNSPEQNGLCYISDGHTAVLSVPLNSPQERSYCKGKAAFFVWNSEGNTGTSCR